MTYEETIHYLYTSTPVFQHSGPPAYKPGLKTSIALDNYLSNPHKAYKTIHIAGTNGKGSVSHLLAAIIRQSGYKVGLYTSPHLLDFRERIRVNGKKISKEYVVDFVEQHRDFFEPLQPSFFELTSSLAFDYFRSEKVDFAIIETGLGGRLDSTNIITPILSIITSIGWDHTEFLGDTLVDIAKEKAGIIKPHIPVLVGEMEDPTIINVFIRKAKELNAPCHAHLLPVNGELQDNKWVFYTETYGTIVGELGGAVQIQNATTVFNAIKLLKNEGIDILPEAVEEGFGHVTKLTGLMGRWQQLQDRPKVICDTGHNYDAWVYITSQLDDEYFYRPKSTVRIIIGMAKDKDINKMFEILMDKPVYYFTQASSDRAFPAEEFAKLGHENGLQGNAYPTVAEAVKQALADADKDDFIFIGGSNFVVAEAIPLFEIFID